MKELGFALSVIGALVLGYVGFIGLDTGIEGFRTTNLAGLFIGSSLLISGSIFASAGELLQKLEYLNSKPRQVVVNQTQPNVAEKAPTNVKTQKRISAPKKPEKAGEQIFVENYKGMPIHQRYNGHYIGEKWFSGLKQARAYADELANSK